jgi:hypothetical protein
LPEIGGAGPGGDEAGCGMSVNRIICTVGPPSIVRNAKIEAYAGGQLRSGGFAHLAGA